MDIKEYISSGIIERFVLGEVTDQEQREVMCLKKIYPEISEAVLEAQTAFEKMAQKFAEPVPEHLRAAILKRIKTEEQEYTGKVPDNVKKGKLIELNSKPKTQSSGTVLKLALAACFIGVILLGLFNAKLSTKIASLNDELINKENIINEVKKTSELIAKENEAIKESVDFLRDEQTQKIFLNGTDKFPNMKATIYWNKTSEKVAFQTINLPEAPTGKQYQLWAIINGVPTDMGMINTNSELEAIQEMYSTTEAQAFAITLEPLGGSISPTMDEMYVYGEV